MLNTVKIILDTERPLSHSEFSIIEDHRNEFIVSIIKGYNDTSAVPFLEIIDCNIPSFEEALGLIGEKLNNS